MEQNAPRRVELRFVGVGGAGLLTAGQVLAAAAFSIYPYVSWSPSYTIAVRGGGSESTVILSHDEIYSPIIDATLDLVVVSPSRLKHYEDSVRPGGLVIMEKHEAEEVARNDLTVIQVPALQMALDLGDLRISNFVLLGSYVGARGAVPDGLVLQEIEKRFAGNHTVLRRNRDAFHQGLQFVKGL